MEHEGLIRWSEHMEACRIPRWSELPDIDLYMDQVVALVEKYMQGVRQDAGDKALTPSMINNYVKQGVVPPPARKKYSRAHLSRLIIICLLKDLLSISEIKDLYFNRTPEGLTSAAYDGFCAEQERAFSMVAHSIREDALGTANASADRDYGILLNLVVLANAGKMTIQKMLNDLPKQGK